MTISSTALAGPGAAGEARICSAASTFVFEFVAATCPASRAARASSSRHAIGD